MRKYTRNLTVLIFLFTVSCPVVVRAVSYSPVPGKREEKLAKGIREKGEMVCLFQSGTEDVRKEIHINDLLTVYRETAQQNLIKVGKIKVLSFAGDDYLKAIVVEGEVMTGDVAKKGDVASLVISQEDKCK